MAPKWFNFLRLAGLSPTPVEMAGESSADDFHRNEPVRANMRKHGDNGRLPRPIDHYVYFQSPEARERYREFVIARGYRVEREDVSAADDGRVVIIFSKVQAPIVIDQETALLKDRAIMLGGEYDGWETENVRGS